MEKRSERVPAYLSRKLRLLSFGSIVAVVLIHAYNYTDTFLQPSTRIAEGMYLPAMIEFFFSNALAHFANPLFFAISGYLLFAGLEAFAFADYVNTLKKRVISLVVPYMFWVFLWTLIGLLILNLIGGDAFPILQEKFAAWDSDPFGCVYNLPLAFQFWFIKDLMKLMLLSPLFFLLASRLGYYSMLVTIQSWCRGLPQSGLSASQLPRRGSLKAYSLTKSLPLRGRWPAKRVGGSAGLNSYPCSFLRSRGFLIFRFPIFPTTTG